GLEALDRVLADHGWRGDQLDAREPSGPRHQAGGGDLDPGPDYAPHELAVGGHHVEVRAGPEVDDDGGSPEAGERGERVHHAVGANLPRVIRRYGDPGLDPRS